MIYLELEEVRMWNGCENTGCHVGTWAFLCIFTVNLNSLSLPAYFYRVPKHLAISWVMGPWEKEVSDELQNLKSHIIWDFLVACMLYGQTWMWSRSDDFTRQVSMENKVIVWWSHVSSHFSDVWWCRRPSDGPYIIIMTAPRLAHYPRWPLDRTISSSPASKLKCCCHLKC